jgi:hypothetical protein
MFSADLIHSNDEARFELERASHKAAQTWRFRHVRSKGARLARAAAHAMSAAVVDALGSVEKALAGLKVKPAIGSPR